LPSRFRYQGSAYGVAGVITTPFQEIIHTQAASNLADFGGYGSGHSEDFAHREILKFERAHTECTGSRTHLNKPHATYSTLVKSTIEGLNIMGMITADKIVANLVSTYEDDAPGREPAINLIGSRFENLRIAGIPVKVCLNLDVLDGHRTHGELSAAYPGNPKVRDLFGNDELRDRYASAPDEVKEFLDEPPSGDSEMPQKNGVSRISIVRKAEFECDALKPFGHVVHIQGFGTIRLGEVCISKHSRRLSMIQVRFGCPVEGFSNGGVVEGGGST
jgi:hypothetical protein